MMSKKPHKAFPTSLIIRALTDLVFLVFTKRFGIKKKMPLEVRNLQAPYLILANHVGFWDPFVVGFFLPHFIHFVSSDAVFRNPFLRFFLTRLGTIPKKKNMRDSQVIRDIISVIKQGENVGIFPEGVRTWSGATSPMDASIGKLIKLLKVPVVVPIMKGMNLMHPRWSYHIRPYPMEVEYKLLFSKEEVAALGYQELFEKLSEGMKHDEVDFQRSRMGKIKSNKRAEYISHALYLCPECQAVDSFRANGNDFHCQDCSYGIHINSFGFFEQLGKGKLHFDNIRDWFDWEEKTFVKFIRDKYILQEEAHLFKDQNMKIFKSDDSGKLLPIGLADVSLYWNKILIEFTENNTLELNFQELQTINPQTQERLEIFYNNQAYRITGTRPGVSALKWEVAVNTIWKEMGLEAKMVPYIKVK